MNECNQQTKHKYILPYRANELYWPLNVYVYIRTAVYNNFTTILQTQELIPLIWF